MKMTRAFVLTMMLGSCVCSPEVQRSSLRTAAKPVPTSLPQAVASPKPSVTLKTQAPATKKAASPGLKTESKMKVDQKPNSAPLRATAAAATAAPNLTIQPAKVRKPPVPSSMHKPKPRVKPPATMKSASMLKLAKVWKPPVQVPMPRPSPKGKAPATAKSAPMLKQAKGGTPPAPSTTPKLRPGGKAPATMKSAPVLKPAIVEAVAKAKPALPVTLKVVPPSHMDARVKEVPMSRAVSVKSPKNVTIQSKEEVHHVAKQESTKPLATAHVVQLVHSAHSAPAPAPANAPAGAPAPSGLVGDWRKEYAHTTDTEQLKWKVNTDKPGTYNINTQAPPKLLPIGEGAYQSSKAVAQRTKDTSKDCETGKWNDCFLKHGGDLTDGHTYGNLKGKYGQVKSGSAIAGLGVTAFLLLLTTVTF